MRVLVVGGGGREHALGWRLQLCESVTEVLACPGNAAWAAPELALPGLPGWAPPRPLCVVQGDPEQVALAERPDLVVIGPEAPLCDGLADRLRAAGIAVYGPSRAAAALEGSKAFMKRFCERHQIRTAAFEVVSSPAELEGALERFAARGQVPVVKADGLCAGKGVVVPETQEEARAAAEALLAGRLGRAGQCLVLEERLMGQEASVHAVCDGEGALMLPAAQDHKRIGEGDTGPNTGGMGAYAPAPLVSPELLARIREEVTLPVLRGMAAEGAPFIGTLFIGVMVSPEGEPWVLEFNVRFGDPETEVLMPILDGDLAALLLSAAQGALKSDAVTISARSALCVVLASAGYPGEPRVGEPLTGVPAAVAQGALVFQAGTRLTDAGLTNSGGRVLGVTAARSTLAEAREVAYAALAGLELPGGQYRRDIAARALPRGAG
ncbi:MAG: phosphoribosylamine--glycine ligase [Polyangiaceae bacterium]|nr:phosphoribosylamine--glycine ligase [Polyangiaceae bacterium]MCW5791609.1 phosphoribosylamine--glycine ligase [Polyangiaceae bacterium]